MPTPNTSVPGPGAEKSLGSISREMSSMADSYEDGPTGAEVSLETISINVKDTEDLYSVDLTPDPSFDGVQPHGMDEFSDADTMLCTELFENGELPKHIYDADCEITRQRYYGTNLYKGYSIFAPPYLWLMRNSIFCRSLIAPLVAQWAYYMAYENKTITEKSNIGERLLQTGMLVLPAFGILSNISKNRYYTRLLSALSFIITILPLFIYSYRFKKGKINGIINR